MARFNFSLGGYQVQVQRQAVVSMRTLQALELAGQVLAAECVDEPEERLPQGPGWFDSSWELVQGLDVREGPRGDARLNEWLVVCLRG